MNTDQSKYTDYYQMCGCFVVEAFDFLNLDRKLRPQPAIIVGDFFDDKNRYCIAPHIDCKNRKINWPKFHESIMPNSGLLPTPSRIKAYSLAWQWTEFIRTGKTDFAITDGLDFGIALSYLKGVPFDIRNYPKEMTESASRFINSRFGLGTTVETVTEKVSGRKLTLLRLGRDAEKRYFDRMTDLADRSRAISIPEIPEGQPGSRTNPFENVDEAANYILRLQKRMLESDPYRQAIASEQYFYDLSCRRFRISWASPNVAYYAGPTVRPDGFVVNQLQSGRFSMKPCLVGNKFLFRGQSEFYPECLPSLLRPKKDADGNKYVPLMSREVMTDELQILLEKHPVVAMLERGLELFHDRFIFEMNYLGLSQHYGNPTPYLDLTSSMEVAKFFAVTTFNTARDAYEIYTGTEPGVLYFYNLEPDAFMERDGRDQRLTTIGKQVFMRSGNQYGFLLKMKEGQDFNRLPETRKVFFRHRRDITDRIFRESHNGDLYKPAELIGDIWRRRTGGDLYVSNEAVRRCSRRIGKSRNKIVAELRKEGIRIVSESPAFTPSELESLRRDAGQIWREFCSKVYFYSPEGTILKQHLDRVLHKGEL